MAEIIQVWDALRLTNVIKSFTKYLLINGLGFYFLPLRNNKKKVWILNYTIYKGRRRAGLDALSKRRKKSQHTRSSISLVVIICPFRISDKEIDFDTDIIEVVLVFDAPSHRKRRTTSLFYVMRRITVYCSSRDRNKGMDPDTTYLTNNTTKEQPN